MDNGLNYTDKENGMNGWQRLWVVGSVILAIAMVVFGFGNAIREDDYSREHDSQIATYQTKLRSLQYPGTVAVPNSIYDYPTDDFRTVDEVKSAIRHADDAYKEKVKNLPWVQAKQAALLFAVWMIVCLAVYGVGLTLRWVYRGFRPKKA
ncbi:hypothetical protein KW841_07815 [Pseudomonas sp. PDM28]|uniref:hypothetical protein n=1 Tax=Pseudomonas sp. PDM28 TaxID=2854770 RepID=UPI001C48AB6C|nr:hypothetical protein [Pseudomonas sp. PDM28]MBV7552249.1 hypothetical protein [Pseudomonas sp. PDM28]